MVSIKAISHLTVEVTMTNMGRINHMVRFVLVIKTKGDKTACILIVEIWCISLVWHLKSLSSRMGLNVKETRKNRSAFNTVTS